MIFVRRTPAQAPIRQFEVLAACLRLSEVKSDKPVSGQAVQCRPVGWGTISRTGVLRLPVVAATNKLPSVGPNRTFVESGGLVSYGPNLEDEYRRVAVYVDRMKGEKRADLPVQASTKYELLVNLKTAKAFGPHNSASSARSLRPGDRTVERMSGFGP